MLLSGEGPRLAICGLGSAALRAHLPALTSLGGIALVGIADSDVRRLEAVGPQLGGVTAFASLDDLLGTGRPELLVVATPPGAHREAVAAAVERGIDVLCEKPLGLSPAEAGWLADLAADHPRRLLATVLQYRHAPAWQRLARAGRAAALRGEPFRLLISVERPGTDPLSAGDWRSQSEGGGILGDHAVHHLSLLRELDARVRLGSCSRSLDGRGEAAVLTATVGSGSAEIQVSYRGDRRRNLMRLELPGRDASLTWEDGRLTDLSSGSGEPAAEQRVGSLSDRDFVNDLYQPLYAELLLHLRDAAWRQRRTTETVDVARLLAEAISIATTPAGQDPVNMAPMPAPTPPIAPNLSPLS